MHCFIIDRGAGEFNQFGVNPGILDASKESIEVFFHFLRPLLMSEGLQRLFLLFG